MMWTALIPVKGGVNRKSRLAGVLSDVERASLSDRMAAHVLAVAAAAPSIARTVCLAPNALDLEYDDLHLDLGRGLNAELAAYRAEHLATPTLIMHGDLPLLSVGDLTALIVAAERQGAALAPDRLGEGTNAIALMPGATVQFAFGPGSCAAHQRLIRPAPALVVREGLSHDVDTPHDLDLVRKRGLDLGLSSLHCLS